MAAAVIESDTKQIVDVFLDFKGKVQSAKVLFSYKRNSFEPNIFLDSKTNEFYFTCTVESGGAPSADLKSGLHMILLTKLNGTGAHASNTNSRSTMNLVGYTNNTLAKTSGYYNEHTDR